MSTSLQTRSKAHDVIRRMLSSLGDPYTRFLSPAEVSCFSETFFSFSTLLILHLCKQCMLRLIDLSIC